MIPTYLRLNAMRHGQEKVASFGGSKVHDGFKRAFENLQKQLKWQKKSERDEIVAALTLPESAQNF